MSELYISKVVSTLPTPLAANALYLVKVGSGFRPYVTNSTGTIVSYGLNPIDWSELTGKPTLLAAANNLSDVASLPTARANLGISWRQLAYVDVTTALGAIAFTNTLYSLGSFSTLRFTLLSLTPATNSVSLAWQFSANDGSTWNAGTYEWVGDYTVNGSNGSGNQHTFTYGYLNDTLDNTTDVGTIATVTISNFNKAKPTIAMQDIRSKRNGQGSVLSSMIMHSSATAWNAIRFFFDSGNIASGAILVEGLG